MCKFSNECPYHWYNCDGPMTGTDRKDCVDFLITKVAELEYHICELEGKMMDGV